MPQPLTVRALGALREPPANDVATERCCRRALDNSDQCCTMLDPSGAAPLWFFLLGHLPRPNSTMAEMQESSCLVVSEVVVIATVWLSIASLSTIAPGQSSRWSRTHAGPSGPFAHYWASTNTKLICHQDNPKNEHNEQIPVKLGIQRSKIQSIEHLLHSPTKDENCIPQYSIQYTTSPDRGGLLDDPQRTLKPPRRCGHYEYGSCCVAGLCAGWTSVDASGQGPRKRDWRDWRERVMGKAFCQRRPSRTHPIR
ncbi:hypothetical protein F5884DRAFT_307023 [Xylogone sp. PMI_703]|nr:hypothetical protein F5884DRAFT_307023 [Xylogone sp. PMI_703]